MKGSAVRVRASASVVEPRSALPCASGGPSEVHDPDEQAAASGERLVSAPDTWASRDLPLLAATLRRVEAGDFSVGELEAIREELEITPAELLAGLNALDSTRR